MELIPRPTKRVHWKLKEVPADTYSGVYNIYELNGVQMGFIISLFFFFGGLSAIAIPAMIAVMGLMLLLLLFLNIFPDNAGGTKIITKVEELKGESKWLLKKE